MFALNLPFQNGLVMTIMLAQVAKRKSLDKSVLMVTILHKAKNYLKFR